MERTNKDIVVDWLGCTGIDIEAIPVAVVVNLFVNKVMAYSKENYDILDFFTVGNTAILVNNGRLFVLADDPQAVMETAAAFVEWHYEQIKPLES